jgi:uncharacterized membrane protein YbhN (UPF0104 family)
VVSIVALAGVVYWATRQSAPRLPQDSGEWLAVLGAVLLYGLATVVRGERWHRLLTDQGGRPSRQDTHGLNVVGYMGNNLLPARAGDAIRVVLMAPRAALGMRSVVGTLLAERLLDVVILGTLFVVLAVTIAGGQGLPSGRTLAVAGGVLAAALAIAVAGAAVLVRRGHWDRVRAFAAPMLASTRNLRGRHGAAMLGISAAIWLIEGAVWGTTAAAANVGLSPVEGFYVLALTSMFALIPSGPGYAGTVDAATILGVHAVGGRNAFAYLVLVRFVVFVPITIVGLVVMLTRYGGLAALRPARERAAPS